MQGPAPGRDRGRLLLVAALGTLVVLLAAALRGRGERARPGEPSVDFAWLDAPSWEGQAVDTSPLRSWLVQDPATWPRPAEVVLYRASCEVCGLHFDALRAEPPALPLVLVRVPEPGPPTQDVLERAPAHRVEASLLPLPRGYGVGTPLRFRLDEQGVLRDFVDLAAEAR